MGSNLSNGFGPESKCTCGSSFIDYEELISEDSKYIATPGDLIEIARGRYRHWALFAEKGANNEYWCFHVGICADSKCSILKHPLWNILLDNGTSEGIPSKFRIKNKEEEAKKEKVKPLNINEVIKKLEKRKDEIVPYSVLKENCEYYVTEWKYGKGWSQQVKKPSIK